MMQLGVKKSIFCPECFNGMCRYKCRMYPARIYQQEDV